MARLGFRYTPRIDIADAQARRALVLMAPRAIGLGVTQITFIVITALASTLGNGAVADFNFAFALLQIPLGIIGVPLGIVVLPSLSREAAVGREDAFAGLLTRALRLLIFVMVPIAFLTAVVREPVVEILFGGGQISASDLDLIAVTLVGFLVGLTAHAMIAVLARAFYARQDTVTPVVAARRGVAINCTLAVILVGPFGLPGIAVAIAIAAWIEALALLAILYRRLHHFELSGLGRVGIESVVGSIVATIVAVGALGVVEGALGREPGRLILIVEVAIVSAGLRAGLRRAVARVADTRTADYRRGHGRRHPPPGEVVTDVDPAAWDRFVAGSDPGSYLQTSAWAAVKAVNGWSAHRVVVGPHGGGTAGSEAGPRIGAQVLVRRPRPMPWGFAYAPRGPVASAWTPDTIGAFTAAVRERLPADAGRVSHLRIDPEIELDGPADPDGALRSALRTAGWRAAPPIQPNATRVIDLRADEEALWGDLRKKWRQYVNKARTGGVTVVDAGAERLPEFYRIYRETADRAGFLIRAESAYRDVWEAFAPSGNARLLFAQAADGEPQATLLLVRCGPRVVEPYGGMTAAGAESRANYLLKWEAIRTSREAGRHELRPVGPRDRRDRPLQDRLRRARGPVHRGVGPGPRAASAGTPTTGRSAAGCGWRGDGAGSPRPAAPRPTGRPIERR